MCTETFEEDCEIAHKIYTKHRITQNANVVEKFQQKIRNQRPKILIFSSAKTSARRL